MENLTKEQQVQQRVDTFNKTDVELKQWRDSTTNSLGFVEEMNHTLSDLAERGFSYRDINSLMGNQIAQHARTRGDRRYLGFLDEIKTAGGAWGNTKEGLKLKQITWDQIDSDENDKVRKERATFLHNKDVLVHGMKAELGTLFNKKRSLTKQNEIDAEEKKIQELLASGFQMGVGDHIQTYYNNMITGVEKGTRAGQAKVKRLSDFVDEDGQVTVKQYLLDQLQDPSTDTTVERRTRLLNDAFLGKNIILDKDGISLVAELTKDFVPFNQTNEYKGREAIFTQIEKNSEIPYKSPDFFGLKKPIPVELKNINRIYKDKFREVYSDVFTEFSDVLEGREEPKYGYNNWSQDEKKEFERAYQDSISPLIEEYEGKIKEFKEKNDPSKKKAKEEIYQATYRKLDVKEKAPKTYVELHDMLYDLDDESKIVPPMILLERLKIGMVGLLEGYKEYYTTPNKEKESIPIRDIANLHLVANDTLNWYEASIGDERNPVIIKKKLEKMWDWALYVLEYQEIERINGSNKTREVKDQEIKRLKDGIDKEEFPTLERLAGAKKIIKEMKEAEKKKAVKTEPKKVEAKKKTKSKSTKPTSKNNNNMPRTKAEEKAFRAQLEWEKENIIDPAKNVLNSIIKFFD